MFMDVPSAAMIGLFFFFFKSSSLLTRKDVSNDWSGSNCVASLPIKTQQELDMVIIMKEKNCVV